MRIDIFGYLLGCRDYTAPSEYANRAADIITRSGVGFRSMKRCSDGLRFSLVLSDCARIERLLCESGVAFDIIRERGLPRLLYKYRRRIGIPIGAVIFAFILIASERFVWSIDVVGNEDIPTAVVTERLEELGFGIGTYVPDVDIEKLCMDYLFGYKDTAWISVNVRGTHARVEVLEMKVPETVAKGNEPCNLVASEDAVIYSIDVLRGKPTVAVGDLVKKGELIASGMVDIKSGFLLFHADGTVKGEVERYIRIETPLETQVYKPTEAVFCEKYLNIFGISVKFFANTENLSENCDKIRYDKIETRRRLTLPFGIELPIEMCRTEYPEYALSPIVYSEEDARKISLRELSERIEEAAKEGEIIARETDARLENGVYVIDCKLTLIRDIGVEQPIYTDNSNYTQER